MGEQSKKLGVMMLAALVVSAMVGGGIFSLPQNMSQGAGAGAVLIAWIITGVGIFFLANTFRILADARPDATTGIYAYARLGFGRFAGFQMAWCYWLCNVFGNVAYAVLLMDALNYFFPGWFTHGNNIPSIIGGSCVIWLMNFLVLRGVKQAAFLNVVGTICKLVPIVLFIVVMLFVFRFDTFRFDFWGHTFSKALADKPLGGLLPQIKSTMLVTLWAFIGIEGAVVISGRAKSQRDVGKATVLGFFTCLIIYFLLSILPFGCMSQGHLAALENPSTAPLLSKIVGSWGGWVMNLGVIIALMTSWLAFTIMIAHRQALARLCRQAENDRDWFFKPWNAETVTDFKTGRSYAFADAPRELLATDQRCWRIENGASWHGFSGLEENWVMLDPIKVSILTPGMGDDGSVLERGVPAALVSYYLYREGIVPTRTTDFQIMFLFSMGVTKGKWGTLLNTLLNFRRLYQADAPVAEVFPELAAAYPDHYGKDGVRTLSERMFRYIRKKTPEAMLDRAFGELPRQKLTPREAYRHIVTGNVEMVPSGRLEGRVSACSVIPYPPGIPMMMSGEVFGGGDSPQIKYLKQLETWDAEFTGFEHVTEGAERIDGVYHVMCVKQDA